MSKNVEICITGTWEPNRSELKEASSKVRENGHSNFKDVLYQQKRIYQRISQ